MSGRHAGGVTESQFSNERFLETPVTFQELTVNMAQHCRRVPLGGVDRIRRPIYLEVHNKPFSLSWPVAKCTDVQKRIKLI